jgi:hypothetical protein
MVNSMNPIEKPPKNERPEKVRILVDSQEQAVALVAAFWRTMPHGRDLVQGQDNEQEPDWEQELTAGDRTMVHRGILPHEKGKMVVLFMGNNQPLTEEAVQWLKERGYSK